MTKQIGTRIPDARDVFALSWPMTLKAMFLHGTIVVDGFLVSALGETPLAAMGLAAAVAGLVLGIIFAFSHAMQIRTAQSFGTNDQISLKSVIASGLAINLSIGFGGVALILIFGERVLEHMAPNAATAAMSWTYLKIFLIVLVGESIGQCLSSYFNGCGKTRIPLNGYLLSFPVNILSSVILIHGYIGMPALGVAGAAIGSVLGITVQSAYFTIQLLKTDRHLMKLIGWRQSTFWQTIKRHFIFSLPIAATFVSASFATHACSLIYARMDLYAFAALTLIAPWNMLLGQISMQWTQASGIIVAQLLGGRTPEDVLEKFFQVAWRGAIVMAALMSICFVLLTYSVDILYKDLTTNTRDILFGFLPLLVLTPFLRTTNAMCGNTLRASGDTIYVMHIFLWSQWLFRVPATALLVLYFEASAFWVLSLILFEEVLKIPAFHRRLFQGHWKEASVTD